MKIPADNISQSLLKPLDTEATSVALDSARSGLGYLGPESSSRTESSIASVSPTRDPGETILSSDVWNSSPDASRRLDLSAAMFAQPGDSAALDNAVDAILAALQ